jgi:hypothetical protein
MSKQKEQKRSNDTADVKVGKLPEQDKELKNVDAENIRGGGGAPGGVLGDKGDLPVHKSGF